MARKVHRSARGEIVNFDELTRSNKKVIAVGNASMNAQGDKVGLGGKVIKKADEIPINQRPNPNHAYNQNNPKAVKLVSLKQNIDNLSASERLVQKYTEDELTGKGAKTPAEALKDYKKQKTETKTNNKRKLIDSEE